MTTGIWEEEDGPALVVSVAEQMFPFLNWVSCVRREEQAKQTQPERSGRKLEDWGPDAIRAARGEEERVVMTASVAETWPSKDFVLRPRAPGIISGLGRTVCSEGVSGVRKQRREAHQHVQWGPEWRSASNGRNLQVVIADRGSWGSRRAAG